MWEGGEKEVDNDEVLKNVFLDLKQLQDRGGSPSWVEKFSDRRPAYGEGVEPDA